MIEYPEPRVKNLADHYGLDHQLVKLQEECQELTEAVANHFREQSVESKWALVCEMADVLYVLKQCAYKLSVTEKDLSTVIEFKYRRQLFRIANEPAEDISEKASEVVPNAS